MRVPRISLGKFFNVLLSAIGRMASWPMRNIETFPSQQMYLYHSLVERKVTEFYHNIDRRRYLVWFKWGSQWWGFGKAFNVLQSPIGQMASRPMRNIETFPSKQMYLYLSLVERKVAEFYPNDLFSSLFPDNWWCPCDPHLNQTKWLDS